VTTSPVALFLNLGEGEAQFAMQAVTALRNSGVRVDLYPDNAKQAKQFTYAEKRNIPFVVTVGEQELLEGNYTIKNLISGDKTTVNLNALKDMLSDIF
ncbi:MAG: histidine--tRNA ligase, partial [Flavobacterium sp.]|uniref:His/Gly/Thr/Pro-type tRNA ligase C-terminal domain-containing protein n=1 Tax=Flavobacterium sp. TaxID=239 RepID=UPI0011F70175